MSVLIKNDSLHPVPVTGSMSVTFPPIQQVGGTVDIGNIPTIQDVAVTNFPPTQNIDGDVSVNNFPPTQTVDGTVAVSNFPPTVTVDGLVAVSNLPAVQPVSGSISVSNLPATQVVSGDVVVTNLPAIQTVSGSVGVNNFPATQPVSGSVDVNNFPAAQTVSGTVNVGNLPATQPVSGTVYIANPEVFLLQRPITYQLCFGGVTGTMAAGTDYHDSYFFGSFPPPQQIYVKCERFACLATTFNQAQSLMPLAFVSVSANTGGSPAGTFSTAGKTCFFLPGTAANEIVVSQASAVGGIAGSANCAATTCEHIFLPQAYGDAQVNVYIRNNYTSGTGNCTWTWSVILSLYIFS